MAKTVKFYDAVSGKPVRVPEDETRVTYSRKGRGKRRVKMLTAKGPKGNKLYKIVG